MANENTPVAAPKYSVDMIPVESSNISAVGWQNNQLFVRFHNGGEYKYANVPNSVFQAMMSAESKGHYLAVSIKNKYPFAKIVVNDIHKAAEEEE